MHGLTLRLFVASAAGIALLQGTVARAQSDPERGLGRIEEPGSTAVPSEMEWALHAALEGDRRPFLCKGRDSVSLADLRVRDEAWARMDPRFRSAHQRLWIDVVRHASEPYVPAAASLLAFVAWQSGDGALANIAIERALAADPGYSMAQLIGQAVDAGLPPSAARLPMTPEEVEASYAETERAGRSASARRPAARRASRRPSG